MTRNALAHYNCRLLCVRLLFEWKKSRVRRGYSPAADGCANVTWFITRSALARRRTVSKSDSQQCAFLYYYYDYTGFFFSLRTSPRACSITIRAVEDNAYFFSFLFFFHEKTCVSRRTFEYSTHAYTQGLSTWFDKRNHLCSSIRSLQIVFSIITVYCATTR